MMWILEVNGWPSDVTTDKFRIRSESLLSCELDIIGIAETHLRGHIVPVLDGYTAYTHNRQYLLRNAKCGSGSATIGVCLFIKNVILESYDVNILDNKVDDILWLQLSHKITSECVNCCVCYLSPEGSSRQYDPHEFFNHLL